MADYHFTICYRPGRNNNDADGLSLMPLGIEDYMNSCKREVSGETVDAFMASVKVETEHPCKGVGVIRTCALSLMKDSNGSTSQPLTSSQIHKAQEDDEVLARVIWYKTKTQTKPSRNQNREASSCNIAKTVAQNQFR